MKIPSGSSTPPYSPPNSPTQDKKRKGREVCSESPGSPSPSAKKSRTDCQYTLNPTGPNTEKVPLNFQGVWKHPSGRTEICLLKGIDALLAENDDTLNEITALDVSAVFDLDSASFLVSSSLNSKKDSLQNLLSRLKNLQTLDVHSRDLPLFHDFMISNPKVELQVDIVNTSDQQNVDKFLNSFDNHPKKDSILPRIKPLLLVKP